MRFKFQKLEKKGGIKKYISIALCGVICFFGAIFLLNIPIVKERNSDIYDAVCHFSGSVLSDAPTKSEYTFMPQFPQSVSLGEGIYIDVPDTKISEKNNASVYLSFGKVYLGLANTSANATDSDMRKYIVSVVQNVNSFKEEELAVKDEGFIGTTRATYYGSSFTNNERTVYLVGYSFNTPYGREHLYAFTDSATTDTLLDMKLMVTDCLKTYRETLQEEYSTKDILPAEGEAGYSYSQKVLDEYANADTNSRVNAYRLSKMPSEIVNKNVVSYTSKLNKAFENLRLTLRYDNKDADVGSIVLKIDDVEYEPTWSASNTNEGRVVWIVDDVGQGDISIHLASSLDSPSVEAEEESTYERAQEERKKYLDREEE